MRHKRLLIRLLGLGLGVALAMTTAACDRKTAAALDAAAACIDARPDSALTIIRAIDTTRLGSRALRARYALLHAIALDKNWIDTTDVGVVMPAVEYYERYGTADQKMKAYFYLGRIQYTKKAKDSAIISYMKAEAFSNHSQDELSKGLLSLAIADIYYDAHSLEKAQAYTEEGEDHFAKAKDTLRVHLAEGRLAMIYQERQEWGIADSLFRSCIGHLPEGSVYRWMFLSQYAAMKVVQSDPDPAGAISLLSQKYKGQGSLNARDYGVYAYASALSGDDSRCNQILAMLEQHQSGSHNQAEYMEYRIAAYRKNYAQALSLLRNIYSRQDTLVYEILGNSVAQTLQDYYEMESVETRRRLTLQNVKWMGGVFLLLVFLAGLFLWMKRKREKENELAEKTIRAAEEANKMLRQSKDSLETDISRMRLSFLRFYQNQLERIGSLCEAYTKTKDRADLGKKEAVYRRVEKIVEEINKDEESFVLFEQEVNQYFDGVLDHLKSDLAGAGKLTPLDVRFLCFTIAGFDASTLSVLLDISLANVYTRRSRLKDRIRNIESPYKEQYLRYVRL